jgi:hypothetical protein
MRYGVRMRTRLFHVIDYGNRRRGGFNNTRVPGRQLVETTANTWTYWLSMAQPVESVSGRRRARRSGRELQVSGGAAAALLVAAAGALHRYLWFDYFHRVHVVGVLFLVNAAAGILLGAALVATRNVLVLLAAGGYALATLAAFAVSTRWGLLGYRERFWGSWQEAAGAIEVAIVAFVVALLATVR